MIFCYVGDIVNKMWNKVDQDINFNTGKHIKLTNIDALFGYLNKSYTSNIF